MRQLASKSYNKQNCLGEYMPLLHHSKPCAGFAKNAQHALLTSAPEPRLRTSH